MLKNWTVRTERVSGKSGGLIAYKNYLSNADHKNHSGSTIVELQDNDKFLEFCVTNTALKDLQITKGRRVESYAQSFVFSLPPEIQPSKQQWQAINNYLTAKIKDKLDIQESEAIFSNLHLEKNKNSHLNMMISRTHKKGQLISNLDKFEVLGLLKKEFNNAVKTFCNIETKDYLVKDTDKKNQARKIWQYKAKKKKRKEEEIKTKSSKPLDINARNFFTVNKNQTVDKRLKLR